MARWLWRAAWVWVVLAGPAVQAAAPGFALGPVPGWVTRIEPDAGVAPAADAQTDGVQYLLVDDQLRHDGRERTAYRHRAARALNERGVEQIANLKLQFDPSYERLTIHAIVVRRGGSVVSRLERSSIRLLQRETELDALLYDGSVTASTFLDDVRVGDIVEYAYSVLGSNPVFGQRQFGYLPLQWGVPVARVHVRHAWPAARALQWKLHGGAPEPVESESGGLRQRVWDLRDVPGRRIENDAPAWFDPYRGASWTDFDGWGDVARWALPLYQTPATPAPAVAAEARRIGAAEPDAERRLLAVLRWVQGEVRYLGIEIGAGSHAPSRPEDVLRRRFGDCKDKARLMVAMLAVLGIEAHPALVNTQRRGTVRLGLPSPGAFNHVVVHARIDGRDWWLDPTRSPQAAEPRQVTQSDHGNALLVQEDSSELSPMAGEQARRLEREVSAVFDARGPRERPVPYTVTTVVRGPAADNLRAALAGSAREATQKDYLNFYAAYYRGIGVVQPLTVSDDVGANVLTVVEHYEIKDFWVHEDSRRRLFAPIHVPDLSQVLRAPPAKVRESPLWQSHPLVVRHRSEVLLSGDWRFPSETRRVDAAAFELQRRIGYDEARRQLLLEDHYVSRLGEIAAADVPAHVKELDKANDVLDYGMQVPDAAGPGAAAEGPHWLVAIIGTLALIGLLAAAVWAYRWDPEPWPVARATTSPPGPRGIGGWLLVVAFGLLASAWRVGKELLEDAPAYAASRWVMLTQPGGEAYHPAWLPLLLFDLLGGMALLVLLCLLLALFFRRRSSVPRLYLVMLALNVAIGIIELAGAQALPPEQARTVGGTAVSLFWRLVFSVAWASYFMRSSRVAATFVERRPRRPPTPSGAVEASEPVPAAQP